MQHTYRALKSVEGTQADALGWTFHLPTIEELHLCIANAQRNSYTTTAAYLESCANTLRSLEISDDARSTCLDCVHTTAVKNVFQQDRDETNALVTASTTEDMSRLPLAVDKPSFAYKAATSMNFNEVELQFVLDRTALKSTDNNDGDDDDEASDLLWPLVSALQLRQSVVHNCIPKVWSIQFQRKPGDISCMYSVVLPGTLGVSCTA